jgi:rhodanese-related sulfurtransferase
VTKISTAQAEALLNKGASYVDVRTAEEFADGHVPGAINVPVSHMAPGGMSPNEDFLKVMLATFEKDQVLVVGCKAGGRSARATSILEQSGFIKIHDMAAGFHGSKGTFGETIPGWLAEGREVEVEAEEDQTYAGVRKLAHI